MKIELEQKDVEDVLLGWARGRAPGIVVNTVEFDTSYSSLKKAVLFWEEPAKSEDTTK